MKNKNSKNHISVHQRIERLCHHKFMLGGILVFMAIGLIKYETHIFGILHDMYNQGFGMIGNYAHHDEVTRMPIQYGSGMRSTNISGSGE